MAIEGHLLGPLKSRISISLSNGILLSFSFDDDSSAETKIFTNPSSQYSRNLTLSPTSSQLHSTFSANNNLSNLLIIRMYGFIYTLFDEMRSIK